MALEPSTSGVDWWLPVGMVVANPDVKKDFWDKDGHFEHFVKQHEATKLLADLPNGRKQHTDDPPTFRRVSALEWHLMLRFHLIKNLIANGLIYKSFSVSP